MQVFFEALERGPGRLTTVSLRPPAFRHRSQHRHIGDLEIERMVGVAVNGNEAACRENAAEGKSSSRLSPPQASPTMVLPSSVQFPGTPH